MFLFDPCPHPSTIHHDPALSFAFCHHSVGCDLRATTQGQFALCGNLHHRGSLQPAHSRCCLTRLLSCHTGCYWWPSTARNWELSMRGLQAVCSGIASSMTLSAACMVSCTGHYQLPRELSSPQLIGCTTQNPLRDDCHTELDCSVRVTITIGL